MYKSIENNEGTMVGKYCFTEKLQITQIVRNLVKPAKLEDINIRFMKICAYIIIKYDNDLSRILYIHLNQTLTWPNSLNCIKVIIQKHKQIKVILKLLPFV